MTDRKTAPVHWSFRTLGYLFFIVVVLVGLVAYGLGSRYRIDPHPGYESMVGRKYVATTPLLLTENGLSGTGSGRFEPETIDGYYASLRRRNVTDTRRVEAVVRTGAIITISRIEVVRSRSLGDHYAIFGDIQDGDRSFADRDLVFLTDERTLGHTKGPPVVFLPDIQPRTVVPDE